MGRDYYSPRPNFLNIGMDPYNKKEIEKMESFRNIQDPVRRANYAPLPPCPPPMGDKGFMVRNNARLAYTAVFDFEYDNQSKVHSEVSEGDKVFATFNNSTKGEFKVVTITAILTKIEPINNGKDFVLYLDASEENKSSVYKIGSRVLLDIGRILEDGETIKDLDPADTVEEITHPVEFPRYPQDSYPLPPCPPPPGIRPPFPPPGPKPCWPLPKKPDVLTWSDKSIESVKNEELGYEIANITYSKKKPIQTLLIIYSMSGEVVYKAIDNSLKLSSLSNFTWDYRNYSSALHDIPMLDKLENFSVDSTGRIVLTPYDTISDKAKEYVESVQKSNDYFIEPGEYFVEIAAGPDIINYNPLAISEINKDRVAISTKIIVTKEAILNAAYVEPTKEEPDTGEETTDPVTPSEGDDSTDPVSPENPGKGENTDVPSTPEVSGNEGTEENPSNPETPSDSKTEDPNKEENNDTSDIGTTESETPTTGDPEKTGEKETADPSTTTTEENSSESITE